MAEHVRKRYLRRPLDGRMTSIISYYFQEKDSVIDIACGSGLYGKYLKKQFKSVYAIDYDKVLCETTNMTGYYDKVICDRVENTKKHFNKVSSIFCSEFMEHVSNDNFRSIMTIMESVAEKEIIITVPNPLSPHFRYDPTHILKYSIYSFLIMLNQSKDFTYTLHSLGFSELNLEKRIFRLLNPLSKRFAILSPTVLYIGKSKVN